MKNHCRFLTNVSRFFLFAAIFICLEPVVVSAQVGGFGGYVPPQTNNNSQNNLGTNQNSGNAQPGNIQSGNAQNENPINLGTLGTNSGNTQPGMPAGNQASQITNGNLATGQNSTFGNATTANLQQTGQNNQILYDSQIGQNGQTSILQNQQLNSMPQGNSVSQQNFASNSKSSETKNTESTKGRVIPPPADFQLTEVDLIRLNEFLTHWENFGKSIKRVACNVQVKEFDGGLFHKDSKTPISHTWGQFRFIAPNKILYHVRGDFSYQGFEEGKEPKWQEANNEWKFIYDGKSMTHYDFIKTTATVIPIVESEWNQDLTLESPFPLFFVANAQNLKDRFYMRLITKPEKAKTEVWIEAVPRYSEDAKSFKSIIITLRLKDLQPYYMRKYGVNGKSYTDFTFEEIAVNKGNWGIDSNVNLTWTKKVEPEYSFKFGASAAASTAQSQDLKTPASSNDADSNSDIHQKQQNAAVQPTSSFNPSLQRF